jgi:hypothetical protein
LFEIALENIALSLEKLEKSYIFMLPKTQFLTFLKQKRKKIYI